MGQTSLLNQLTPYEVGQEMKRKETSPFNGEMIINGKSVEQRKKRREYMTNYRASHKAVPTEKKASLRKLALAASYVLCKRNNLVDNNRLIKLAGPVSLDIPFNDDELNEFAKYQKYDDTQTENLRKSLKGGYLKMDFPDFMGVDAIKRNMNAQGLSQAERNWYNKVYKAYQSQYGNK